MTTSTPTSATRRAALIGLACSPLAARAQGTSLEVAAASSLTDVMPELARAFAALPGGTAVRTRLGASGTLLEGLATGLPADLLLAADSETLTRGVERRLLRPESVRGFAGNTMVLIVPAASTLRLQRLTDLALADAPRIAMGRTATVPAGRYARQAIDAARLWPALQRRIVPADSARHALDLVMRGDVDAGFVYRTDALAAGDRVRVVETLSGHAPVRLGGAVTTASRQPERAAAFIAFLRSEPARSVLQRLGFVPL